MSIKIAIADPLSAQAKPILGAHMAEMIAITPAGSVYSLDAAGLAGPGKTFWLATSDGLAVGSIGLCPLKDGDGEIKSMHVLKAHRGRGIAQQLLDTLEAKARAERMQRLWLETGPSDGFAPARRFYAANGYRECPRFGPYAADPNSYCMNKAL